MNSRLNQIDKRIEKIKEELLRIEAMRPGSLTKQYKDREKQEGAYYQLSYTLDMKSRTSYIPKEFVRDVKAQIKSYKRHKALNAEWVKLSIERSQLAMKLARQ